VLLLSPQGDELALDEPSDLMKHLNLLQEASINIPPATRLAVKIGLKDLPLTADELCRRVSLSTNERLARALAEEAASSIPAATSRPGAKPVLEVSGLTYAYSGGQPALRDVSLRIHEGDFIGVVGPNGSGKSTLLKHLVGLLRPLRGAVYLDGKDTARATIGQIASTVGMLMQNPDHQLLYEDTVFDEVAFSLKSLSSGAVRTRVRQALRVVGLEAKQEVYPGKLSYGERRKLVLASVMALEPRLIVLDEPFFGLDYFGRANLAQILKSFNERGHSIVVATHDMDTISRYADRLVVMFDGNIVADAPTGAALFSAPLEEYDLRQPDVVRVAHCLGRGGLGAGQSELRGNRG
jgi:energy-coupling factor transporter ATP-binding protein EcfA2